MHNIQVDFRKELGNGFRLKVSDLDLGIYVDGFRASKSIRNESGWWIQEPSTYKKKTGEYVRCPEYDKTNNYWKEIEQACIDCVNEYLSISKANSDNALTEQDLREALQQFGEDE